MAGLVEFVCFDSDVEGGEAVGVNPAHVIYVERISPDQTALVLSTDRRIPAINVEGSLADVIRRLNGGI
jgi:hypothetical protein